MTKAKLLTPKNVRVRLHELKVIEQREHTRHVMAINSIKSGRESVQARCPHINVSTEHGYEIRITECDDCGKEL